MMRRNALARGGGLLSLGMVWSQAMYAKAGNGHGHGHGHGHHAAFTSPPSSPSTVRLQSGSAVSSGGPDRRERHSRRARGHHGEDKGGDSQKSEARSQLIFVGCGSSTAVPSAFLLLHPELETRQTVISQLAVATPPEVNKNYRGNTSVLVRVVRDRRDPDRSCRHEEDSDASGGGTETNGGDANDGNGPGVEVKHIQIDTGKTWREGVIRWFPRKKPRHAAVMKNPHALLVREHIANSLSRLVMTILGDKVVLSKTLLSTTRHGVRGIDGIVLTHDHADAMLGLDDVRSIQDSRNRTPTPVHLSRKTDNSVRRVFPYLVGREDDNGKGGRFVAALKFNIFEDFQPFEVGGLEITPFPVLHGEDYISHGFLFGPEGNKVCYISDVSRVPPETMEFLQRQGPIQVLVCDALLRSRKHPTHFSVEDSVELAAQLKARRTLLVGMGSDVEYHASNALLASREEQEPGMPHVRIAHDGLAVDVDL